MGSLHQIKSRGVYDFHLTSGSQNGLTRKAEIISDIDALRSAVDRPAYSERVVVTHRRQHRQTREFPVEKERGHDKRGLKWLWKIIIGANAQISPGKREARLLPSNPFSCSWREVKSLDQTHVSR